MKTLITILTCITILFTNHAMAKDASAKSEAVHNHSQMDHANINHVKQKDKTSAEKKPEHKEDCANALRVKVDGLVCDFCARALEKVFGRRDEVENIEVDLSKGTVLVMLKPQKTIDDATLTKVITDAGYNVKKINRGCDE